MILKPLGARDAAKAAILHAACFPDPWPEHAFTALLDTGAEGFAAIGQENHLGLILFRAAADEAEILTFAVHPEVRRQKLATKLLLQTIAALEKKAVDKLLLEVAEDNLAALSLYRRVGFEIVGERSGYYTGAAKPINALIMAKQICHRN